MSAPTTEERVTTLEAQMANTLTKAAGASIEAGVGARYSDLLGAYQALLAKTNDLTARLNDALVRLAALEAESE